MKKCLIFLIILLSLLFFGFTKAGEDKNIYGSAWSENIGWISFNNSNAGLAGIPAGGGTVDYGVNIEPGTGEISGEAWSENIGWISFNEVDLNGCPEGACIARVDLPCLGNICSISGWARVMSYKQAGDTNKGWISLRGTTYGVQIDQSLNPKEFSGQAFGDDVIGWISFNSRTDNSSVDYKTVTTVNFNSPPVVTNFEILNPAPLCCGNGKGIALATLNWRYTDSDNDPQASYSLQVFNESNNLVPVLDIKDKLQNVNSPGTGSTGIRIVPGTPNPDNFEVSYNHTYTCKIKVKDSKGEESVEVEPVVFTAPVHPYPWVSSNFSYTPAVPRAGISNIIFEDKESICYDNLGNEELCSQKGDVSYFWDFKDGSTGSVNPIVHRYDKSAGGNSFPVELTITDDQGSCLNSQDVGIGRTLPLPKWVEIAPTL